MAHKNILLIEPSYKNKYPPLGLMKIAQYHGPRGKADNVTFIKGEDESVLSQHWDRVYVTTLFSFEWKRTGQSIDFALQAASGQVDKVFVGGIAAYLMHQRFLDQAQWHGVRFITGLLDRSPAQSLHLDDFSEELYSDDIDGRPIEELIPDYGILDQIPYRYPVHDAYFSYASRGCIRKCSFCGVPKLEGAQRDTESISYIVRGIEDLYGPKKDLVLMDNNVVASPRFRDIIAEIRDLGFVDGATLERGRVPVKRRVDFNQGVDARILCKNPAFLRELSTICISPLRIAFDHLGLRKPYCQAIKYACDAGLTKLSNYMLYNFHDTPKDLFERMRLNVTLNEQLGVRIFSFPMRYQPTDLPDRSHIGKHWNRYWLRSMQLILQATHGIVSGSPEFFRHAFGDTYEEFEEILIRPQHFIFNRGWYEQRGGRAEFDDYRARMHKLGQGDRAELIELLCSHPPSQFATAFQDHSNKAVKRFVVFYRPLPKDVERQIWAEQRKSKSLYQNSHDLPEDEKVEDAGLDDDALIAPNSFAMAGTNTPSQTEAGE